MKENFDGKTIPVSSPEITTPLIHHLAELLQNMIDPPIRIYTIEEVATLLQCKESTIKYFIHRTRELSACQIGRELRIRHEDLQKFLANRVNPSVYDKGVLP